MLDYGAIATRYGVLCEQRDDGVTITLPATYKSSVAGAEHFLVLIAASLIWIVRSALNRPMSPSMIIELNRTELRITQHLRSGTQVLRWPREEVGELRANRYSRGLLVRIPGKQNFDILTDRSADLIDWIGETLTEALRRTEPARPSA